MRPRGAQRPPDLPRNFPALLDAVAAGELHLTGLLMIGPHLTPKNQAEVLARAKFRTKKELSKLVRDLNPLPTVPDRIEPLGPEREPMLSVRNPTWEQFAAALSPQVRELPADEQPCRWANDGIESADGHDLEQERATAEGHAAMAPNIDGALCGDETLPVGPVPSDLPPVTGPQLFQMQFATVEEHVLLVERAKALLSRERPRVTLGELHIEAMKLLVAALEKRTFAVTEPRDGSQPPPRRRGRPAAAPPPVSPAAREPLQTEPPRQRVAESEVDEPPTPRERVASAEARDPKAGIPRQRIASAEAREPKAHTPCQRVAASETRRPKAGTPRQRVAASENEQPTNGIPRQRVAASENEQPAQRRATPAQQVRFRGSAARSVSA